MIKFDTDQIEGFKARLKDARESLGNNSGVMRQIGVFLDRWVQKNFQSSGGNVGGWVRFKYGGRLTKKGKQKGIAQSIDGHHYVEGGAKLLQDTGALRLSFLPFTKIDNAGIGSDLHSLKGAPYPLYHEEGTSILPQRRMLPKEADVAVDVREIMENWLGVTIRKALS